VIGKIRFKKIKTRLTFWFLIVALLPLIAVSIIISQQRTRVIKENAFHKLTAVRDLKAGVINNWINERISDIKVISGDLEVRAVGKVFDKQEYTETDIYILRNATKLLNRYVDMYEAYEEIFIINPFSEKTEVSTNRVLIGLNKSQDQNFTEPMRTGNAYIKDIYYSKTAHRPSMTFSIPIYAKGESKRIAGILVARIDLEQSLYKLLLDRTGMGNTGETLLVNKDGLALNELRWHRNAPLKLKIMAKPALMASHGRSGITEAGDYRGEDILAAYTYIPRTRWGFVAKQDLKEVYRPVQKMIVNMVIIFLVSATVVYLFAFFTARNIVRPVHEMTKVSRRIQKGDLSARNHIMSEDELGFLAQSFNNMADSIGSQLLVQENIADLNKTMAAFRGMQDFAGELLKKLIETTGSNLGAFHLLTEDGTRFENFTSVGISPELLEPFDATSYEGELGKAVAVKEISHIMEIPEDTVFKFKTFTGTLSPKEIITIPIIINEKVVAVISLASLNPYSKENLEILNQTRAGMNTAFSNLVANEQTMRLAEELGQKNQELKAQAEELQSQTEELQSQAEELQQTSEEIQEQNVELEVQSRQVEEANRLKSEFLSNMSHELRTPLNSVMALSKVLMIQVKDRLSEEELNYLEIIQRNGQNLLSLINDILDLSKIEAGRMDIKPKLFSIRSTIETIMERLEPVGEEKGIDLNQEIQDNLPQIESDEQKVHKILQNLLGNAIKFTEKGHVTVSAHSDADKFYIEVADTGIGMSDEDLSYIFEEFRQIDGTSARHYEGTGLGLAIAYKTAKILGGDLSVKSVPGKGSIFILTLPLKWPGPAEPLSLITPAEITPTQKTILTANDEPEIENQHKYQEIKKPEAGTKILLVEDNEAAVIQVRKVLESEGYEVDVVRGGQEALDYVKQTIPEGIILDLMMPEVDGFEVLEKIRGTRTTAQIPVLILTAKDLTPEDLNKLSHNNIQQLIQKGDVDRRNLLFKTRLMLGAKPGVKPATRNPKPATRNPQPATRNPQPATILVIEDNPDNMITIKAVLQNKYSILEATDGEEGLKKTLAKSPDLVLLDISLPEMDGFTVVRKVKENKETRHIPVIALTARVMKGDREKILEAGCDDYIAKPIDPEEVLKKIEKWLE
jgi:signal transduction histidine kinase/CheY-like chemotaxis protein/HAMP domain-containing protein